MVHSQEAFDTKGEAQAFARYRKAGFRFLAKSQPNREHFFLKVAIPTVRIRKAKRPHWKKALYFVEGL